jgi:hypothetical protein
MDRAVLNPEGSGSRLDVSWESGTEKRDPGQLSTLLESTIGKLLESTLGRAEQGPTKTKASQLFSKQKNAYVICHFFFCLPVQLRCVNELLQNKCCIYMLLGLHSLCLGNALKTVRTAGALQLLGFDLICRQSVLDLNLNAQLVVPVRQLLRGYYLI